MGGGGFHRDTNGLQNVIRALKHVVVPEMQHAVTFGAHPAIALCIVSGFKVLTAVHLNDQALFQAYEVRDVPANRLLSAKSSAFDLALTQAQP